MQTLAQAYQNFNLEQLIEEQLVGTPHALNAYTECCGRHVGSNKVALIWEGKNGESAQWTFDQLAEKSGQLAHYFQSIGLKAGDCVAGLLPRTPELLITILATWRMGAIYQPLFTAFESKAIQHRIETACTKLIVTNTEQRPKLNDIDHIQILNVHAQDDANQDADFWKVLDQENSGFEPVTQRFEDDF